MKHNFQQEMASVKEQMLRQQQLFQNQMQGLLKEQQATQEQKYAQYARSDLKTRSLMSHKFIYTKIATQMWQSQHG